MQKLCKRDWYLNVKTRISDFFRDDNDSTASAEEKNVLTNLLHRLTHVREREKERGRENKIT